MLPTPSARDLDLLRSTRRARVGRTVVTVALSLAAFLFLSLFATYLLRLRFGEPSSPPAQRAQLVQLRTHWSSDFTQGLDRTRDWFQDHGTATEAALFDGLSGVVVDSLLSSNSAALPEGDLTQFGHIFIAIHISIVRLLFFIIASFRLCVAVGLLAFARGIVAWKPYRASDALGQMGNGRVFYSGAYATLEAVTPEGIPDKLTRGLACPQTSSLHEAKRSALWQVLLSFSVANRTNAALTQILVRNSSTAPYVPLAGDEARLAQTFNQTDLLTNATALLNAVLSVHSECKAGVDADEQGGAEEGSLSDPEISYPERVASVLRRVLTPAMRTEFARMPPAEIATFVLAFESGKVLAHSYEGERWVRRSNFVHLSARAVLHSLVEYPAEYPPEVRTRIRTALVYAARKSPFSPIRLPVNLDTPSQALRQVAEVLLACPHELPDVATELELLSLVRGAHAEWCHRFSNNAGELFIKIQGLGYSTRTNLLFLPIGPLVTGLRLIIPQATLERMKTLVQAVAAAQARAESQRGEDEGSVVPAFSFERVRPVPALQNLDSLAAGQRIHSTDLHDWLVLRYVLSSFGWLASRVGDYTVPDTGVVFAVFQANQPLTGANSFGRLGASGMVPLRGTKVREQLGASWHGYFTEADRVVIAETDKEYERLLQGIEDRLGTDELEQGVSSTAETTR
jgi:hypothetical protein